MAGHSYANKQKVVRCEYPLRDDTPCQAAVRLNGRCEHHSVIEAGKQYGWTVHGSRKQGSYVAQKDDQVMVAPSARQLFAQIAEADGAHLALEALSKSPSG